MAGLFSTFNVATRGLSAQQKALDVIAHNISNANTEGYSRQRATMETTRPFGMPSMNNAMGVGQLGTGVQISSIVRIRDSFLDYQVRTENGTMGLNQAREKFLTEIESIMNEPSDTGVSSLIDEMFTSWQALAGSPESSNTRTVVAEQSKALTEELNNTYNQLIKLKENSQSVIKQNVVDINTILDQINVLNQQVISVKVGGNEPNDLMDKRDLLIDQLSEKFGITIEKKSLGGEDLKPNDDGGTGNEYLIKSAGKDDVRRFSYVSDIQKSETGNTYDVTYYKNGDNSTDDNKVTIKMELDSEQFAQLDQGRVLWSDNEGNAIDINGEKIADGAVIEFDNLKTFSPKTGELKGYMSVQADIDKYIGELNSLAKAIAFSINAVHSGKVDAATNTDILNFFVNSEDEGKESEITAGNISVNKAIIKNVMLINVGKDNNPGSIDNSRALAIAQLRYVKLEIQSLKAETTRAEFFKDEDKFGFDETLGVDTVKSSSNGMTISGYFTDIVNRLGVQTQTAKKTVINHESLLAGLNESRASISGVSLDEEMANMIQYQHAYQANAKIISTVDELLDLIINGLKK